MAKLFTDGIINTNNKSEDFILDNTVDNLLENSKDILKSTQFGNI